MDILGIFSRRHMLMGLGGVAVAGAASAQGAGNTGLFAQSRVAMGAGSLGTAGFADWSAQVGSNFTTSTGHVLKLVSVQAYDGSDTRPAEVRDTGFVARFDIVRGDALPEGRHLVADPKKDGAFEIFLAKAGAGRPMGMVADYN